MKRAKLWVLVLLTFAALAADRAAPLFSEDFQKAQGVPDDMLVLAGEFSIKKDGEDQFLELAGEPLDSFGLLFGPGDRETGVLSARVRGTAAGKRFPEFGIALNDAGGYRLWLMPASSSLQLIKGDQVKATVPCQWASGQWTMVKLQLRQAGEGRWVAEGKVWKQGGREPAEWMIKFEETEAPTAGRPSLWGNPYSGTPLQYDDLTFAAPATK